MPHTLVTGANSFVAAHIIDTLISEGHTVTGSVRRASAGEAVLKEHPEWKGKLDFIEIENYSVAGVWDEFFKSKDVDYVVHVAAPMYGDEKNTDYDRDWLKPGIENNLSLLRSAKAYGKNLKHISATGSINSITMGDDLATRTLTNESWNNITPEFARTANNGFVSYCSSKKEAEQAAWKFMETEKPNFGLTIFLPALIFGPPIQPVKDSKHLNFSVDTFYSLFDGRNETIPATMFPSYIDVRDLALAHVKALTEPAANNKRFLIGGQALTYTAMMRELKNVIADGDLPKELESSIAKESTADENTLVPKIDAQPGNDALKIQFRSLKETVGDMAKRILEIKARE